MILSIWSGAQTFQIRYFLQRGFKDQYPILAIDDVRWIQDMIITTTKWEMTLV